MTEKTVSITMKYKGDLIEKVRTVTQEFKGLEKHVKTYNGTTLASERVVMQTANTTKKFGGELNGLITRFFGVQAAINLATQAFHASIETIEKSTEAYRKYQKEMSEISTILGDTSSKTLPSLQTGMETLSLQFGISTTELSKGLYEILSANVDVADSMQLLRLASKSAIAGLSSVETAVDSLTTIMNSYGLSVSQLQHISDVMFAAVVKGKFTYDELANALGYVVPIAAQVGISFDEIAAAFATATRHGLHVDMTARGLALAIQNIIKPSKEAAEEAAKYGITLSQAMLEAKGLLRYMKDLNEATNGNASVLSRIIPNMRSYRIIMVLAGNAVDDFAEDVELMSNVVGGTDDAFTRMANNYQMMVDIYEQSNQRLSRALGSSTQGFTKLKNEATNFWTLFVGEMSSTNPADTIGKAIGGIVPAAIQALMTSSEISSEINKVIDFYVDEAEKQVKRAEESIEPVSLFKKAMKGEHIELAGVKQIDEDIVALKKRIDDLSIKKLRLELEGADTATLIRMQYDIDILTSKMFDLQDVVTPVDALFKDFETNMTAAALSIESLNTEINQYIEEVGKVGDMYDGTLGKQLEILEAEKTMADQQEYMNLAMEDTRYLSVLEEQGFSWLNSTLMSHITTISKYKEEQKKVNDEIDKNTRLVRLNNLEISKIELQGMMRRRGLTRSEERKIKMIQIENAKLHIDSEEASLDEKLMMEKNAYEESKEYIDNYVRDQQHALWVIQDTRQKDIDNLKTTILAKETAITEETKLMKEKYDLMSGYLKTYGLLIEAYYGVDGIIPDAVQNTIDKYKELLEASKITLDTAQNLSGTRTVTTTQTSPTTWETRDNAGNIVGGSRSLARGSNYIPETGLYKLHRGEQVVSPGDTGNATIHITINNHNSISNDMDAKRVANLMAQTISMRLSDATGKSKYRFR